MCSIWNLIDNPSLMIKEILRIWKSVKPLMASLEQENPFSHLKLSSWDPLRFVCANLYNHNADCMHHLRLSHCRKVVGRTYCPTCGRSRKFYCYSCYHLIGLDPSEIPRVRLPVKIDMYVTAERQLKLIKLHVSG